MIMQQVLRIWIVGIIPMMLLTISVGVLGFSHKAPTVQEQQIVAAALQGYDVADICAGDVGSMHFGSHCAACHNDDSIMPSRPVELVRNAELRFVAKVVAPCENRAARMVRDPALGLRAPPVFA